MGFQMLFWLLLTAVLGMGIAIAFVAIPSLLELLNIRDD
jgi:hypothetical protein